MYLKNLVHSLQSFQENNELYVCLIVGLHPVDTIFIRWLIVFIVYEHIYHSM